MNLVYCYDAYCNWCFGFSTVINRISNDYKGILEIEVLSGGMILPQKPVPIHLMADYFQKTYKQVETTTGVVYGSDYLWHLNNAADSDWYPNSEKPAIALCIFKEYFPESQVLFATTLQFALFVEGRDLCDDEAYRHLVLQYNIPEKDFYEKLHSKEFREQAYEEFAVVKKLKVTGYPGVFVQITTSKFHLVANGYTDYNTVSEGINNILNQTSTIGD